MAAVDTAMVRIYLTFTPEQAKVVRGVLGKQPAVKLYEICAGLAGGSGAA